MSEDRQRQKIAVVRATIAQALLLALASAAAWAADGRVKIHVREAGAHVVTHEALAAAGWASGPLASSALELSAGGQRVPMWVEDGGDGSFGRGDQLVFIGGPALAPDGRRNVYARANVYYLSDRGSGEPATPAGDCVPAAGLAGSLRFEKEVLRARFAGAEDGGELWYWARLTPLDAAPFEIAVEMPGLDTRATAPLRLRAGLRGWSQLPGYLQRIAPDHRVELTWNGRAVATHDWREADGAQVLEARLPASAAGETAGRLTLRVPERRLGEPAVPVADAVLLDWIEVDYPHLPMIAAAQELLAAPSGAGDCVPLSASAGERVALYPVATEPNPEAARWWAVRGGGYRTAERVELDEPVDLRRARRADLVMIAHPRLLAAAEPLAALHRRRGLAVELVSVDDVYDEYSHGVVHPEALRGFLRHTQCCWTAPAPRHVLLVGDASWDVDGQAHDMDYADWTSMGGDGFIKNSSTPYSDQTIDRDLIPTGSYGSDQGPVASDNWIADLDGDELPDVAIGRLPVASEAEVAAIVRKIASYLAETDPGPWRNSLLWITNEFTGYQNVSNDLAAAAAGRGFASREDLPAVRRDLERGPPPGPARGVGRGTGAGPLPRPRRALHLAHRAAGLEEEPRPPDPRRPRPAGAVRPPAHCSRDDLLLGTVRSPGGRFDRREAAAPARQGRRRGRGRFLAQQPAAWRPARRSSRSS